MGTGTPAGRPQSRAAGVGADADRQCEGERNGKGRGTDPGRRGMRRGLGHVAEGCLAGRPEFPGTFEFLINSLFCLWYKLCPVQCVGPT